MLGYLFVCWWSSPYHYVVIGLNVWLESRAFFLIQGVFSPPVSRYIHHVKSRTCYCPLFANMHGPCCGPGILCARGCMNTQHQKGGDLLLSVCVVFVSAISECLPVVHWAMQLPSGMCLFAHCLPRGRSVCSGVLCFWIFICRYWHVLALEMTRSKYMPHTGNEKWWYFECSLVNSTYARSWTRSPCCIKRCIFNLMQHFPFLHSL